MAGAGDFEYFLVGGFVILAVLLLAFNLNSITPGGTTTQVPPDSNNGGADATVYPVGIQFQDTSKSTSFNFRAANIQKSAAFPIDPLHLESGLFFGDDSFEYRIGTGEFDSLKIEFEVRETNELAPLVVMIDNQVVVDKFLSAGRYEYTLDSSVISQSPVVRISARSSGWQIWAPTVYNIENIKITTDGFLNEPFQIPFAVGKEFQTFENGRIDFNLVESTGSAIIKLNGRQISRGPMNKIASLTFNKDFLRQGNNVLSIEAEKGGVWRGKGTAILFYKDTTDQSFQIPINLRQSEYDKLIAGSINFRITDIDAPGGYVLRIVNSNKVLLERFETVEEGGQSFSIAKEDLAVGTNFVVIKSLSGARFAVTDFDVEI